MSFTTRIQITGFIKWIEVLLKMRMVNPNFPDTFKMKLRPSLNDMFKRLNQLIIWIL